MPENWLYRWRGLWRGSQPSAGDVLRKDRRAPVVYLRSFADELDEYKFWKAAAGGPEDQKNLAPILNRIGPYIALGRPGEPFPELGAARVYVANDEWQQVVGELIDNAAAIVLQGSPSKGLAWEMSALVSRVSPNKILLMPPRAGGGYDNFRAWASHILPKPLPSKPASEVFLSGRSFMAFHCDWEPYGLPKVGGVTDHVEWALRPFFLQNDFPTSTETIADVKRKKLLAGVEAAQAGALDALRLNLETEQLRYSDPMPKDVVWLRRIATWYERLGAVLLKKGDVAGGREALEASATLIERLIVLDPRNAAWPQAFAAVRERTKNIA